MSAVVLFFRFSTGLGATLLGGWENHADLAATGGYGVAALGSRREDTDARLSLGQGCLVLVDSCALYSLKCVH